MDLKLPLLARHALETLMLMIDEPARQATLRGGVQRIACELALHASTAKAKPIQSNAESL